MPEQISMDMIRRRLAMINRVIGASTDMFDESGQYASGHVYVEKSAWGYVVYQTVSDLGGAERLFSAKTKAGVFELLVAFERGYELRVRQEEVANARKQHSGRG